MNCRKIKNLLSAYLGNELTRNLRAEFERHLKECRHCAQIFKEFQQTIHLLRSLETPRVPEGFREKIRQRAVESLKPVAPRLWTRWLEGLCRTFEVVPRMKRRLVAAGTVVVFLGIAFVYLITSYKQPGERGVIAPPAIAMKGKEEAALPISPERKAIEGGAAPEVFAAPASKEAPIVVAARPAELKAPAKEVSAKISAVPLKGALKVPSEVREPKPAEESPETVPGGPVMEKAFLSKERVREIGVAEAPGTPPILEGRIDKAEETKGMRGMMIGGVMPKVVEVNFDAPAQSVINKDTKLDIIVTGLVDAPKSNVTINLPPTMALVKGGKALPEGGQIVWRGDIEKGKIIRIPVTFRPLSPGINQLEIMTRIANQAYQRKYLFNFPVMSVPSTAAMRAKGMSVSRPRISVNFAGTDIKEALQILARTANANIVFPEDIQGQVTLPINNQPFEQALEAVTKSCGYQIYKLGNVYKVNSVTKPPE